MSSNLPNNNKKQNTRLTAEQTIILIRLVKKYKFLWDTTHINFRNRTICDYFYGKIGRYFQLTGEDVRRKFSRLRNCYRQELKLIRDGQKAYTNMFYFDEMEFLKAQIEERRRTKIQRYEDGDTQGFPEEPHVGLHIESCQPSFDETESTVGMIEEELEEETEIDKVSIDEGGRMSGFSEEKTDEFDTFAGYLASQLREMDKLSALETMKELQQIISKRRISILKRDLKRNGDLEVKPKRCKCDDGIDA